MGLLLPGLRLEGFLLSLMGGQLPLLGFPALLLAFQQGVLGQLGFQQGDLPGEFLPLGLAAVLLGPLFRCLGQKRRLLCQPLLHLAEGLPASLLFGCLIKPGVDGFQLFLQFLQLPLQLLGAELVLLQNLGNEGGGFLHGELPRLG